ncbi:MAG: 6,7-dimethyl-8-ribityllumazine synthase [Candidatus Magasanikbacteria bacterium]|nr:6,7-dimethyl-8-ribityllumazine synthase [Candidatus Magasanikbacteria bacterium]
MQQSTKADFKIFDAKKYRVGIVVAQFNRDITEELLKSAGNKLSEYGVLVNKISVHRVAGSVEIPVVLKALAETKKFDCLVAIGVVIRGDTPHFDYVCKMVSDGVLRVMMDYGLPVGFGVVTTENAEQAMARLHVGGEASEAALQTARIVKEVRK